MKSVRLGADLEAKLKDAARIEGVSESEFIRAAVAAKTETALAGRLETTLAGVIGSISSKGGRAADVHGRYGQLLRERRDRTTKPRP